MTHDKNLPYSRESWNDLIEQVNELASECGFDPLDLVDECHRWSKSDIKSMQDLLVQICEDNEFDPIEDRWSHKKVVELEEAIALGSCCCIEQDLVFAGLEEFAFFGGFTLDIFTDFPSAVINGQVLDIYGWLMQLRQPRTVEIITCPDGMTTFERPTGGYGWIGRGFKTWEIRLKGNVVASGPVVDGYIQIPGEGNPVVASCADPNPTGTAQGLVDPAWCFPYGQIGYLAGDAVITGAGGYSATFDPEVIYAAEGQLPIGKVSAPYLCDLGDGSVVVEGFIRFGCD